MKAVYRADAQTHVFVSSDLVQDGYVLKTNETFESPSGKREPAKLVGAAWQDATEEEHETYLAEEKAELLRLHPGSGQPAGPTAGEKALNTLGLQVASLTAENKQLKQSVNMLGLQVAQAIAKDNKENGGN